MHFCKVCQNLYYIKLTGENEDDLIYYCRNCGDEDTDLMSSLENTVTFAGTKSLSCLCLFTNTKSLLSLAIILSKSTGMSAFTQCEIKTFSLATHFLMNSMTFAGCCSAATPSAFKFCSAWLIALI